MKYRIAVPPVSAGTAAPGLVVALHGCRQTAEDFAIGTRLDRVAAAHGAIALYPEQTKTANSSSCWNWFLPQNQVRDGQEPAQILRLVDEVAERYDVDRTRIYVVGLSAGGAIAAILGEQAPDVFAGVGIMAGVALHASHDLPSAFAAMAATPTSPKLPAGLPIANKANSVRLHPLVTQLAKGLRPVMSGAATTDLAETGAPPAVRVHSDVAAARNHAALPSTSYTRMRVMIWTGTDDTTVAPRNATVLAEQYARLMGLQIAPSCEERYGGVADIARWRDPQGRVRMERWTVRHMGHAWSGGSPEGSFMYPTGPDASTAMLRFFSER